MVPVPVLMQGKVEEGQQTEHQAACDGQEGQMHGRTPMRLRTAANTCALPKLCKAARDKSASRESEKPMQGVGMTHEAP